MAIPPMTNAEILPALHLLPVVHLDLEETVEQVVGDRARSRHDQPADGAEHGGEGDGRDDREEQLAEGARQQRRGHVAVRRVDHAAGHRAQPHEEGQDVEEADRRDRHDGGFARAGRVGHGVVADEDVRQGRGAQEERQHQRQEVEPLQRGAFDLELQAGAHDAVARNDAGIVDGDLVPGAVDEVGGLPGAHGRILVGHGRQELEDGQAAGR